MTERDYDALAHVIAEAVKAGTAPLYKRIGTLETRCAEIEQRPALAYKGIWGASESYDQGSVVTHGGSLWHAKSASIGCRPDTNANVWTLIVKRGADGRDGKAA